MKVYKINVVLAVEKGIMISKDEYTEYRECNEEAKKELMEFLKNLPMPKRDDKILKCTAELKEIEFPFDAPVEIIDRTFFFDPGMEAGTALSEKLLATSTWEKTSARSVKATDANKAIHPCEECPARHIALFEC